jgi:hypothetical protein
VTLPLFGLFLSVSAKMTQIVEEEKSDSGREHPGHGMVVVGYGRGQSGGILTDERVPRSGVTGIQSFPQAWQRSRIWIFCHPSSLWNEGSGFFLIPFNWLRVLGTAERSYVDHRVHQQLHPVVSLLDAFKSDQQPLELVFPRKGALDSHA